jgi:hypothetical protein
MYFRMYGIGSRQHAQSYAPQERADMVGSFDGQNDRRGGIATERGGAFVDAESADQ